MIIAIFSPSWYIVTCSRRNRLRTCRMIAARLMNATQTRFSVSTFLNRLRSADVKAHRPYVGVPLTVRHRRLKLNWARGHYRWSRRRWNRVLFMDEPRFNVQFADGLEKAWMKTPSLNGTDMAVEAFFREEELTFCSKTTLAAVFFVTQCSALLQQSNIQTLDWPLHVIRTLFLTVCKGDVLKSGKKGWAYPLLNVCFFYFRPLYR